MSRDDAWRDQVWKVLSGAGLLRLLILGLLLSFVSLLLGFAFELIFMGMFLFFLRIAPFHARTFSILAKLLKIEFDPEQFVPPPMSRLRIIFHYVRASIYLILPAVGAKMLVDGGFLGQNTVYLLLRH